MIRPGGTLWAPSMWHEILRETQNILESLKGQGLTKVTVSPEAAAFYTSPDSKLGGAGSDSSPTFPPPTTTTPTRRPGQQPTTSVLSTDPTAQALDALAAEVAQCRKCALCQTRTQTVFGVGNPHAELVFVGEAPGVDEDLQGIPFVGKAGKLLTDIIEKGMKLRRSDVYICNVLKCRPPSLEKGKENRAPNPEEVRQCEPYLIRQLEIIRPKIICALGGVAARCLLKTDTPVGKLRGTWHTYQGIPLRVTFHPAYLLRNPNEKKSAWEDIKEVMRALREGL